MAIGILELGAVFLLNAVLGAVLVMGVFVVMERQFVVGALGGVIVGALVIYGEATYGEQLFVVSVQGMKLLVLAAALGAVLGVVATVATVEPEI